ncbi:MAG: CoA transferase, partial [Acidobacteriota bacterium]
MNEGVFHSIKILDLTRGIAGPYCAKLFGAFGAEVIKVEQPGTGDISRTMGPFPNDKDDPEKSGSFFYLNTNKKSITVNLRSQEGMGICKRLIRNMDVLLEDFAPGGWARLGLSKKVLKEINPGLIVTSITPFGQTGPYRNYKANNLTLSALGGSTYLMRLGSDPGKKKPVVQGGFQAEYSTGLLSYIATVAALIGKVRCGGGASIDMASMECVASTLMGHVAEYSYLGFSRRTNPFAIHGYPIGYSVPCRDGWISLTPGIGGAPNIPLLIGRPDLLDDLMFTRAQTRMADPEKFDGLIVPWLMDRDKWTITEEAQELRLAFTPVLSAGELFDDRQLKDRKFFETIAHPELGDIPCPGSPAKLSKTPWKPERAPLLGEHNKEIFDKYGSLEKESENVDSRDPRNNGEVHKLLSGVRILDLTMVFAGPVATKILAELGADIIKIESMQRADVFTRANVYPENAPGNDPWNRGCLFHSLNAGKRGISLNLGTEKGREIFKRLAKKSDAVIENFSPRVMENWGLNYEQIKKVNPRIIMASISGLGHYGPLRDYYMYVPGMEGMSGIAHNTGYPDEPPLLSGSAYGDWVAGANAAMALMTALFHSKATGKGQYVDISGREAAICHIADIVMDYAINKRDRMRMGNKHFRFAPHGCYRCIGDDDWIAIGIETDSQWKRFVRVLGERELLENESFASAQGRLDHQSELDGIIEKWTGHRDKFEIMETLQKMRIPAGAVLNMKEINLNAHLKKRGFFQIVD